MNKLVVLECDHVYNAWRIDKTNYGNKFVSEIKEHRLRKMTEDFRLCGVYHKANLPYEVVKVTRESYLKLEPYQAIPRMFSDEVFKAIVNGDKVLTSSGYCAYAPAIIGGIQRAIGLDKKIGVIWIDAHADNVIVEKTKRSSVTFVGVPLSTIMGQTLTKWRKDDCFLIKPIEGRNVLVSDARLSDKECLNNLFDSEACLLDYNQFEEEHVWKDKVCNLASSVDVIYMMVDADILSTEHIPAYFEVERGGHSLERVLKNIALVMETGKVIVASSFCFDFDKYDEGGEVTSLNAMKVIGTILDGWKEIH